MQIANSKSSKTEYLHAGNKPAPCPLKTKRHRNDHSLHILEKQESSRPEYKSQKQFSKHKLKA